MPQLIWSPSALSDLSSIDLYLAAVDGDVAGKVLRAVRAAADRLIDYPRIGRSIDEPLRVFGVRATPYLLIYRIRADIVEIVRIRHARQDWLGEIVAG